MFCGDGGWLAAAKAINAVGQFLQDQGVSFGFGEYVPWFRSLDNWRCALKLMRLGSAGTFKQPLFHANGTTCSGIETVNGTKYYADKIVLAAGAWSPTLVDLEDQCVSKVSTGHHCLRVPVVSRQLTQQQSRPGSSRIFNSRLKRQPHTRMCL